MKQAVIFDIQRFCLHDGPGIRTVVFFKGCAFNCRWCQNPEGKSPLREMAFSLSRCQQCFECEKVCPRGAIKRDANLRIDWSKCDACGRCAEVCPGGALEIVGKNYDSEELLKQCLKDRHFYASSGGGVTLSGGEPILQNEFLTDFLPRLKKEGVHVLLETAGQYPWEKLEPLLGSIDHIFFDWKFALTDLSKSVVGGSLAQPYENLKKLLARQISLTVRIVQVPGINTNLEIITQISRTLQEIGVDDVVLLPYNHFWESKLDKIKTNQERLGVVNQENLFSEIFDQYRDLGIKTSLC